MLSMSRGLIILQSGYVTMSKLEWPLKKILLIDKIFLSKTPEYRQNHKEIPVCKGDKSRSGGFEARNAKLSPTYFDSLTFLKQALLWKTLSLTYKF